MEGFRVPSSLDIPSDAHAAFLNHYHARKIKKLADMDTGSQRAQGKNTPIPKRSWDGQQPAPLPKELISLPKAATVENDSSAAAFEPTHVRPHDLALQELWKGLEPEIESIFLMWDGAYRKVPVKSVYQALVAFQSGVSIGDMHGDLKAALVHIIAEAMITKRLHPRHATVSQIEYFLFEAYQQLKLSKLEVPKGSPPPNKHWLYGSMRLRGKELEWLIFQGQRRWWVLVMRLLERLGEPSDMEIEALFQTYTQGGDYIGR